MPPLSTRRWARTPFTVWTLSFHTPSQRMRAHCRGQYSKCSMAEIGMTGSVFTIVRLQKPSLCPLSLGAQTGRSATPRERLLEAMWNFALGSRHP